VISVPVELAERRYEVTIGAGAAKLLPHVLPEGVQMAAVVTQEGIGFDVDPGVRTRRFEVSNGESAKTLSSIEELCREFARAGLARSDAVVAVGGGVVSDVAGFAAGVYMRGVAYVNVATTLLAQVDAAIGGKTAVNLEEGKNLVGVFWQPAAVLCDTDALSTLPMREWASGRGEMAKCAFLGKLVGGSPDRAGSGEEGPWLYELPLEEQIARCVAIKAAVVGADEREGHLRMLLNYGHTLAHALEGAVLGGGMAYDMRHGEAVAVGLMFAARLARRLGRVDDERVEMHRRVLDGFELAAEIPRGVSAGSLVEFMARDKKGRHDFTFVLDGPRGVEVVPRVPEQDILATLAEMGCDP
jgi:5-deoxy-5-amino-3-dehydroquinate synthase